MFGAPFAAVRFCNLATNRRTFKMRSGAYAHSRKLHWLSSGLTDWTETTEVDTSSGTQSVNNPFHSASRTAGRSEFENGTFDVNCTRSQNLAGPRARFLSLIHGCFVFVTAWWYFASQAPRGVLPVSLGACPRATEPPNGSYCSHKSAR